ncbi:MAG: hypothetical protein V7637_3933, partial [Mycobacteriales bacterium]
MRTRLVLVAAAAAVTLTGGGIAAAALPPAGPAPGAAAGAVGPLALGDFDFTAPQVAATGLEVPWGLAFLPDGSALIGERMRGRILQLRPGQAPAQVATVTGVVASGEGGLLGLAVSPTFATDDLVYAYFTSSADNRIVRFRLDAPQNQQAILTGLAKADIHDGGRIAFGPDGMLYAGVGDA